MRSPRPARRRPSAATGDWVLLNAEARLTLARALRAAGDLEAAAEHARAAADMYAAKGDVAAGAAAAALLAPTS